MFKQTDPKQQVRYAEAARLSAYWFLQNQNTPSQPWGGVYNSADEGRFLYEYYPTTGWSRGMGVWGQTLGIFSLLALRETGIDLSVQARGVAGACLLGAIRAARYMMTLQILDTRDERRFGAFREHNPQASFSFPRDAATGAFGLLALYRLTHEQEYLERARMFCKWYMTYGSDKQGWPVVTFPFTTCQPKDQHLAGLWQVGGGLAYYYLSELTGEREWVEQGLRPIVERSLTMFDDSNQANGKGGMADLHGLHGNDDFATMTMLAAYQAFGEKKYLDRFARNVSMLMACQHADGSFRNFAGCFMAGLTMLDALQLGDELPKSLDRKAVTDAVARAADFGLTVQETQLRDPRAFGGMYGQSMYQVARDRIHQRSTGYASVLYSQLVAPQPLPYFSALNWSRLETPVDVSWAEQQDLSEAF